MTFHVAASARGIIETRYNIAQLTYRILRFRRNRKMIHALALEQRRLATTKRTTGDREIFSGLIRIHVLHHACSEGVFGLGMIRELRRHGYKIGPGTMYPLLHSLERRGWLRAKEVQSEGRNRIVYFATRAGKKTLQKARSKVHELHEELFEGLHRNSKDERTVKTACPQPDTDNGPQRPTDL